MVAGSITMEETFSVAAKSLWKVTAVEDHVYLPKITPAHIASVEVEGSGGPGTIKKVNFASGAVPGVAFYKSRVVALDEANYVIKLEIIEGARIGDRFNSKVVAFKFEAAGENSCVVKVKVEYDTIGDKPLDAEEEKALLRRAFNLFKKAEEYLLANPGAVA